MAHVVFPAQCPESNRVYVLVEDEGEGYREVEDIEALRAQVVWENFERV